METSRAKPPSVYSGSLQAHQKYGAKILETNWVYNFRGNEDVLQALQDLSTRLDYEALDVFMRQAWFGRPWIVQEAAFPSQLTLCNGSDTMEFGALFIAILIFDLVSGGGLNNSIEFRAPARPGLQSCDIWEDCARYENQGRSSLDI
jgi:hypothetical protein